MTPGAPSAEPSPSSPSPDASLDNPSPSDLLEAVDKLKFFLATAPSTFPASSSPPPSPDEDRALNRFLLPTGELISCVLWNGLYHITGTDIVRALSFRFLAFGRPVRNTKKFEEGVFSDLRNLKSGTDATLEEPKSEFLELLFKHNCIRTQKKQKVFYWFSVPHDRLFLDALDRDLKREKLGQDSTTEAVREPALSFRWNPNKSLFDQFTTATIDPFSLVTNDRPEAGAPAPSFVDSSPAPLLHARRSGPRHDQGAHHGFDQSLEQVAADERRDDGAGSNVFGAFSLFEGSPAYKQRRRPLERRRGGSFARQEDRRPLSNEPLNGASEGETSSLHRGDSRTAARHPTSFTVDAQPAARLEQPNSYLGPPVVTSGVSQASFERSARTTSQLATASSSAVYYDPHLPLDLDSHHRTTVLCSPAPSGSQRLSESPSGIKTYVCPLFSCGRLFKRLEHLKRHVRTHTSEKPFACSTCGKAFARSDNLTAHVKVHGKAGSQQHPCVARRTEVGGFDGLPHDFEGPGEAPINTFEPPSTPSSLPSTTLHTAHPSAQGFEAGSQPAFLRLPASHVLENTSSPHPPSPHHRHRSATPAPEPPSYLPSHHPLLRHYSEPPPFAQSTSLPNPPAPTFSPSAHSSFATHIDTLRAPHASPDSTALHHAHGWQASMSARPSDAPNDELTGDPMARRDGNGESSC